jgi:hypothetical protein
LQSLPSSSFVSFTDASSLLLASNPIAEAASTPLDEASDEQNHADPLQRRMERERESHPPSGKRRQTDCSSSLSLSQKGVFRPQSVSQYQAGSHSLQWRLPSFTHFCVLLSSLQCTMSVYVLALRARVSRLSPSILGTRSFTETLRNRRHHDDHLCLARLYCKSSEKRGQVPRFSGNCKPTRNLTVGKSVNLQRYHPGISMCVSLCFFKETKDEFLCG